MERRESVKRCTGVAASLLAAFWFAAPKALEPDPVASAQTLIRTFFPELVGKQYRMMVYWSDPFDVLWRTISLTREFGLEVQESAAEFLKAETRETLGTGLLNAYCEFDGYGDLVEISIMGRANGYLRYASLRDRVDAHRQWSDQEIAELMDKEGALFGPSHRDDLRRALPPTHALAAIFQGNVSLGQIVFELRSDTEPANAQLQWRVYFVTRSSRNNRPVTYIGTFEPYQGKLLSLGKLFEEPH